MEAKQSGGARELSLHPLWEEYTFPIDESDAMAASELVEAGEAFSKFYFNPYTGHLSLTFQRASRGARGECRAAGNRSAADSFSGGILADEMGLGKTIQMAALIASNTGEEDSESEPEEIEEDEDDEPVRKRAFRQISLAQSFAATRNPSSPDSERQRLKTALRAAVKHHKVTLVIVPMSLLGQWRDELLRAIPGAEVMLYYAETKGDLMARLEGGSVDVVITSFGTLTTEHKRYTDAGGAAAQRNMTNSAPLL
jgi:DNA repair protein RAD5